MVKKALAEDSTEEWRSKLIRQIIGKIEVVTDKVKIHWRVGQRWIKMGFEGKKKPSDPIFLKKNGSRTLQNGWGGGTRTLDTWINSPPL